MHAADGAAMSESLAADTTPPAKRKVQGSEDGAAREALSTKKAKTTTSRLDEVARRSLLSAFGSVALQTPRRLAQAACGWLGRLPVGGKGVAAAPAPEAEVAEEPRPLVAHEAPEAEVSRRPKVLLVVGECGDGKSTLVNALRDPERSGEAAAGLCSRGVTKSITAYVGMPIEGQPVDLLDTPGVGDTDVTPMKVLSLIEQELITGDVCSADAIDGLIVTTPIPDGRVKLGAQLVKLLVSHGFVGEDKWRNVILVGTKADRATQEERDLFTTRDVDENGAPVGIAAQFFADAPGQTGTFVMTRKDDYASLRHAIANLPNMKVQYGTPDPAKMAEAFAEKFGIEKEHFRKELEASREAIQAELNAQFAEREVAMQRRLEEAKKQHQNETQLVAQQANEQREQLRCELESKFNEKTRILQELQLAAPAEREQLERQAEKASRALQRVQEKNEGLQRRWASQLEEKESQLKNLMRQLEDKQRDAALRFAALAQLQLRQRIRRQPAVPSSEDEELGQCSRKGQEMRGLQDGVGPLMVGLATAE